MTDVVEVLSAQMQKEALNTRLGLGALAIEYLRVKLGLGLGLGALAIDILELGLGCIGYRYLRVRVREQKMYNEDDNHSELNTQEDTNIPDDKVIETIEDCYDFR
ncbi:hypothetical protein GLOIN_2v1789340 [Rhizophagus irregularis DAOM 181602=DAOM 197198]|uniref:Uncharacterized protein n=1 Tax=Rhizophagus irregularis (strain DAOM 181602 / DAOM 197198 / MUCL 43194) TaxID=747089 RepID=A0A2P4P1K8_RHIID|nr:hypothetical protein GLOIN_2v1789340 [Rhizophagus irregularis DAOM 181602=DAOM 197198]POG59261.1 hypothetical protein GLOIN_2v1789340 [Rhizophagus irregularis DAOM 181602=DAOM 197198]|eukprot:XP_025166127.1 hypothetical protein GLOIN_2v1789340 [Rhizophagus irregularis DAOM 181602=DAOM 197198]